MLRLTLRSGRDGRLLARVVEREGLMFVLDFGDPVLMADASRRVLHGGFAVEWQGRNETAQPGASALMRQLALFYAAQGGLVFVDEPDWPRAAPRTARSQPPPAVEPIAAPPVLPVALGSLPTLLPEDPWEEQESHTVLRSRRELQELQDRIDATVNTGPHLPHAVVEVDAELETEEVSQSQPERSEPVRE